MRVVYMKTDNDDLICTPDRILIKGSTLHVSLGGANSQYVYSMIPPDVLVKLIFKQNLLDVEGLPPMPEEGYDVDLRPWTKDYYTEWKPEDIHKAIVKPPVPKAFT